MTCSPFSAPEVSGDDDVVADVTSGDDVIDEVPVLGTWVHPFVRHLEHVLVTMRLCSAHKLRSLRPLPLMCPTHFHLSKSIFTSSAEAGAGVNTDEGCISFGVQRIRNDIGRWLMLEEDLGH